MVRRSNDLSKSQSTKKLLALSGKDLKNMDRRELAKVVSTISSAANKRIKRLEQAGQPIGDTVPRFSVAGKSRNELMKEFRRVKDFMNAEQLSLGGQSRLARRTAQGLAAAITGEGTGKEFKKEYNRIRKLLGDPMRNDSKYNTFWSAYERLAENNPIIRQKQYKYRVLGQQIKYMDENPNISKEDLQKKMQADMDSIYADVQKEEEKEEPGDVFTF